SGRASRSCQNSTSDAFGFEDISLTTDFPAGTEAHPDRRSASTTNAHGFAVGPTVRNDSKRIRHSREKELPILIVIHNRVAREKYAVSHRDRHVIGDLPVHEQIRLPTQIAMIRKRRLIQLPLFPSLAENEAIHTKL